ncbi:hypothetical protein Y032_0014g2419 [Ancylostoma ceylanicum]|uniref:Uncharacterized protein n=1 Tax=Ancylostoma ceylanicum TaxID=53326 RepID=A0A016V9D4_9BILA|nr:hypothetical protein Y032_0014g2419 [Ancylostoma ceylanicum]
MFDFGGSPVFIFVPFIAFSVIFLLIILLKSCVVMSRSDMQRGWATQARRSRRTTISHSTASVEIQTSQHPVPFIPPPGYYSEVMATDTSAMYPMYVPPYAMTSTPPLSMRDPRRFQGIPGLQAPPPYPPPPSYSQIQNFPELPTVSYFLVWEGLLGILWGGFSWIPKAQPRICELQTDVVKGRDRGAGTLVVYCIDSLYVSVQRARCLGAADNESACDAVPPLSAAVWSSLYL